MLRISLCLLAAAFAGGVQAQLTQPDPDWKEVAPAPPPLRTEGLIRIDMPQSNLRFGVDPASVSLGSDGVVRYVVVASSNSGAVNAFYEGIRCSTAEVRLYARHNPDSGWVLLSDGEWRSLHQSLPSRHSLVLARTGVCAGGAPNQSTTQIVRDLGASVNWRFWNN